MAVESNDLGQPVGWPVPDWQPARHPRGAIMQGRLCRLEPIDRQLHAGDLFQAFSQDTSGANWTYMPYGPFDDVTALEAWIDNTCLGDDPCFFSVIDLATNQAVGVASYLRIEPASGVIEVGHIHFSPLLQGQTMATEVMYLMMQQVFDELGYRRYEWKCDALNAPSRRAAERLGFLFEGVFRQATMYKGRNRDTAWFAIIDREWPVIREAFEAWLDEDNFDDQGRQRGRLQDLMRDGLSALR